jgi:hypothetical protein
MEICFNISDLLEKKTQKKNKAYQIPESQCKEFLSKEIDYTKLCGEAIISMAKGKARKHQIQQRIFESTGTRCKIC